MISFQNPQAAMSASSHVITNLGSLGDSQSIDDHGMMIDSQFIDVQFILESEPGGPLGWLHP